MATLIVLLGIASYISMAAFSYQVFRPWRDGKFSSYSDEHGIVTFLYTVGWPLAFAVAGGLLLGIKTQRFKRREARRDRRRREELAEAQHQLALAKLQAEKLALTHS